PGLARALAWRRRRAALVAARHLARGRGGAGLRRPAAHRAHRRIARRSLGLDAAPGIHGRALLGSRAAPRAWRHPRLDRERQALRRRDRPGGARGGRGGASRPPPHAALSGSGLAVDGVGPAPGSYGEPGAELMPSARLRSSNMISIRRFLWRPAAVRVVATGWEGPRPAATSRPGAMPHWSWRKRTTVVARATDSSQLLANSVWASFVSGIVSVCPTTRMILSG